MICPKCKRKTYDHRICTQCGWWITLGGNQKNETRKSS